MLCRYFTTTGIKVEQAFEDADTLIVNTAIKEASSHDSVEIVGEDIDLLVLLAGLAPDKNNIFFRKPAKGNTPENLYSPHSFKHKSVLEHILFIHAFSGCDTTSSFYNIGKSKFINTLIILTQSSVELFKQEKVDPEVLTCAGEQFLIALYGGDKHEKSINILRFHRFAKSMTANKVNHLSLLPPTKSAVRQHIFRTYLQVQTWLGFFKDPQGWGWR
ncbi:unnamed protein product [Euphydryas editha]|uniref:Uncharacterized protein n=1 Tax=Euphydryas editha TaxID=104508 RepID=A0AAU9TDU7_EUPED|nr:unnamed protein product [Euphydryas editha]